MAVSYKNDHFDTLYKKSLGSRSQIGPREKLSFPRLIQGGIIISNYYTEIQGSWNSIY